MSDPTPSWQRWPPNCCETCVNWSKIAEEQWLGKCLNSTSTQFGDKTDSRFRCQDFVRKESV